jgi:hypothetical protein
MGPKLNGRKADAFILEGRIIENVLNYAVTLEVEDVKEIKEMNLKLAEGKDYALLVDPGEWSSITEEARELLASPEMAHLNLAKAIIIYTITQRIIGNIYLSLNHPVVETRLFTDREKALEWLRDKVDEFEAKQK